MIQCKKCREWYHGECIQYTCEECHKKGEKILKKKTMNEEEKIKDNEKNKVIKELEEIKKSIQISDSEYKRKKKER